MLVNRPKISLAACMAKTNKKNNLGKKIVTAPGRSIKSILTGGVISSDFFKRHKLSIVMAILMLMFYISTKYQCQTGMETIRRMEEQLDITTAESIRERSQYMSRIRESSMSALADSIRPGLAVQQQPPFILSLND